MTNSSQQFKWRVFLAFFLFGLAGNVSAAVGTWNGGWPPIAGSYNSGADANVPMTATVQESPPQITLTLHRAGAYTIYRKLRDASSWGTALATLPAGSTTYVDTTVVVGETYEYSAVIIGKNVGNMPPTGYLLSGIKVDKTAPRGRLILIVTETIASNLTEDLDNYKRDLGADGWTVHTITVPAAADYSGAGNYHQPIRAQIQTLYSTYPGEVKNVILLGKVPVCRSGLGDGLRPDGHANSYAEACDSYYAEMDATWKDVGNNGRTGIPGNVPGDGKFDASSLVLWLNGLGTGQTVELGFGRIDTSAYQTSEIETTKLYFQKMARYRRAADDFQPGRKGAIRKGFDNVDETGWMILPGLVGPGNIVNITSTADLPADPAGRLDPDGLVTRANQRGPFLFYFKGTGYLDQRDDDSRAVFLTGMQSHWGWWAESTSGGQMVARLGTDNLTLSVTWSIWGQRYLYHRLGMGGDMGDVLKTTINNVGYTDGPYTYASANLGNGDRNGRLWINHMGDPTLRLFPVRPPRHLNASPAGAAGVNLTWTNSDDSNLQGVHIYRSNSPTGPWTQLTSPGSPISATTYQDTPPSPGDWTYSVRAVKLENTPSGTFYNPSIGATITVQTGTALSPLTITTSSLPAAAWQTNTAVKLKAGGGNQPYTWSLVGGNLPLGLTLSPDGTIAGSPARGGVTSYPIFQVTDYLGATAQLAYELGVTARRIEFVPVEADSMVKSAASYVGNNYGTNSGLTVLKSHDTTPLFTDSIAYLRFALPALASGERLEAARLRFTLGSGSASTTSTTLTAALLDDAGDGWVEGNIANGTAIGGALTYTNRPSALNPRVASTTYLAPLGPNSTIYFDFLSACFDTLQFDAARKASVVVSSNTISGIEICSRENPPVARPGLELEITHAPLITLSRPMAGVAHLSAGQGLNLYSTVTDGSPVANQWSVLQGPGTVNFSDPTNPNTTAVFSTPGRYALLFTADDGVLVSQQVVRVHIQAAGKSINDGLVLHYKLDETSGTAVTDAAPDGAAHNGTLNNTGALTWSPTGGVMSGALNYGTNNRYIQTADHDSLDNADQLSIALWMNPTAAALDGNIRGIVAKRSGDNLQEAYSLYMQNGRIYARFNGNNIVVSTSNSVLSAGKWTHLAAIYDGNRAGTAGCVTLYVNGAAVPLVGGYETDSSIPNTSASLWIGHNNGSNNSFTYLGRIDEVRLYRNRALTSDDVLDLLSAQGCQEAPKIQVTVPDTRPISGESFALNATVTDDGLPASPVSLQWSASGVSFTSPNTASTTAVASGSGSRTLRLNADDGAVSTFVDASIIVDLPLPSYNNWAAQISWPPSANSSALGNPDQDGFSNLLEYAFGLNPLAADTSANLPHVSTSGNRFAITFTRDPALTTLNYEIEGSSNLTQWTTIARATGGGQTSDVNEGSFNITETSVANLRRVTVIDQAVVSSGSPRFLRVRVTEP